jgi:hypothetical protein
MQYKINRHNADTLREIGRRAEQTLTYCKENNYEPSKLARDVKEMVEKELFYLDIQGAKVEAMRKGIVQGQSRLDIE